MKFSIENGVVLTPTEKIENGGVLIQDGKILEIFEGAAPECAEKIIDARGNYISPGFIDIHSHGGGGHDFMDGTADAIIKAAKFHMEHGTTSLVPTTLTSSDEDLFRAFECYKQAKTEMKDGPNLLGLHLEGKYFSPHQAGAQDKRFLKNPEREDYLNILSKSDDIVRMSAAPELPGALQLGLELKKRGILASIAHSDATYSEVVDAFEHGFTHVTHFYSAMSMLRRINAHRYLGVVESAYLIDDMTVEIIADGVHLPPELLKFIFKFKPMEKICLITDSMRGAGMTDGTHTKLGSLENGQEVVIEGGVALLSDRSAFAGSVCTADRCVRTVYKKAGVKITDAVRMITQNPAKVMGLQSKGALSRGMDADICIFDDDINVKMVVIDGKIVVNKLSTSNEHETGDCSNS